MEEHDEMDIWVWGCRNVEGIETGKREDGTLKFRKDDEVRACPFIRPVLEADGNVDGGTVKVTLSYDKKIESGRPAFCKIKLINITELTEREQRERAEWKKS